MAVLVTGAAGFIGSNLLPARAHRSFTFDSGDIRDSELLASLPDSIDSVVHLAARAGVRPSIEDPGLHADANFTGTSRLSTSPWPVP